MSNSITNFPITVYGEQKKFSDTITRGRCRVFYKGHNRNGSYITEDFAQKLIASAPYTPIKGIYRAEDGDYADHGVERDEGRIYGIVPADPHFAWESHEDEDGVVREYACFDALYYTALYPEASDIAGKSESMEIYRATAKGDWRYIDGRKAYVFTDGCFLGLQVLGDDIEPCFQGATFYSQEDMILEILARYEKKTDLFSDFEQGGNNMENDTIEVVETEVETEVETSTEAANKPEVAETSEETIEIQEEPTTEVVEEASAEDTTEPENEVEKISEEFSTKISELESTISTLVIERDAAIENYENAARELTEKIELYETLLQNYTAACAKLEELENFKNGVEETSKLELINEYSEILEADLLDSYREQLAAYSYKDLDRDLAYECKKNCPAMFSAKNANAKAQYVPKAELGSRGISNILERYENK